MINALVVTLSITMKLMIANNALMDVNCVIHLLYAKIANQNIF